MKTHWTIHRAGVTLALALLSGCATQEPPPAVERVWPAPPEPARIAYVQDLTRPADAGIRRSGAGRFVNWLTGSERGNEVLVKPFGVALDEQDNLCITDTAIPAVTYYDRLNKKRLRWEGVGPLRFVSPVAVAKARDLFYVADSGLGCVLAFDADGKIHAQMTNRLERPVGLAISGDRLLVADAQRHSVVVFDLDGTYRSELGRRGAGPGEFNFPTHVAADADGTIYVTDSMNGRVQVFDPEGRYRSVIGQAGDAIGCFSRPKGVAVDSFGHVYVVDANFDNIQIFGRDGRILLVVGSAGSGPGEFWLPAGIAISRQGELFVADAYNRRIQVLKYVGQP